jgi:hypothetical protein
MHIPKNEWLEVAELPKSSTYTVTIDRHELHEPGQCSLDISEGSGITTRITLYADELDALASTFRRAACRLRGENN